MKSNQDCADPSGFRNSCQDELNRKKFSRKEMDDLQAFQNFKEAFDHFDWNNTKTIATSVSIEIHISHLKIIVVQMLDLVSKRHSIN